MRIYQRYILILVYSIICSYCQNKPGVSDSNSFRFRKNIYPLDNCTIANESVNGFAGIDVDLSCCNIGNHYVPNEQITTRHFIWFSLTSDISNAVEEGKYRCSGNKSDRRDQMTFFGTVTVGNSEIKIKRGRIKLEKDSQSVSLQFVLRLESHNRITGSYRGPFN